MASIVWTQKEAGKQWALTQAHAVALAKSYAAQRRAQLAESLPRTSMVRGYIFGRMHEAVVAENHLAALLYRYEVR